MKIPQKAFSRREFIRHNAIIGTGVMVTMGTASNSMAGHLVQKSVAPALLGGDPIHTTGWPEWPVWKPEKDEKQVLEVLRSGTWSRAGVVQEFEEKWAETVGAKRCLTTVNGTNALIASLIQLDVGGGDEVLVPPYTFIATVAAILATGAMPVFVDVDPETFQIDPAKIEEKITPRTRAILPVHICGLPADMLKIMDIANTI
jgi:dTDP-4-amino-4,6-dideoxygalactose transaminase